MGRVRNIMLGHHEGIVIETTPADAHVLRMYSRTRSLLEGARVLLNARLPEEAMILGREMFTVSLQLMEIASRGEHRGALVLQLAREALRQWENLALQARSLGVETQVGMEEMRCHVAKERKKIESYRLRHGIGPYEKLRHEKQLAKDHGRLGEYLDFEVANRMVHVTQIAQAGRTLKTDGDVVQFLLRNPDDDSIAATYAFIMRSALHTHKAVAPLFNWTETSPKEIDQLLTEIEELLPPEAPPAEQGP